MLDWEELLMRFRIRFFWVIGLVISVFSGMVAAESVAIAYSRSAGNVWGWARKVSQNEANKVALDLCNKEAQKRDCELSSIKAIARAGGPGRVGYGSSNKSIADAKRIAIESCKHPDCKVVEIMSEPGFISVAKFEDDKEENTVVYVAYGFRDADEADKVAQAKCKDRSGQDCKLILSSSIAGTLSNESSASAKPVTPVVTNQNCRPNTPTIRCQSNCVNGDCIVSYENGCKMRVRVSPRYDGFQNTWVYPSPSC